MQQTLANFDILRGPQIKTDYRNLAFYTNNVDITLYHLKKNSLLLYLYFKSASKSGK